MINCTLYNWARIVPDNPFAFPPSMVVIPACAGMTVLSKYLLWVIVANYEKAVVEYETRQKYLKERSL